MFDLGIIGGMGPAATAELFKRVVLYTSARTDQEHIKICILNDPTVPDRTDFLLNGGASPLPSLLENIEIAKNVGCKYFAIPCNTSHYFYKDFEKINGIEFINMVEVTCQYAATIFPGKCICVLATLGTINSNVYKKIGGKTGNIVYASSNINTNIMGIIRSIKAGEVELELLAMRMMSQLSAELDFEKTVFLLACTELSLLLPYVQGNFIDAMDVLAGTIVSKCNKPINKENFNLCEKYFHA